MKLCWVGPLGVVLWPERTDFLNQSKNKLYIQTMNRKFMRILPFCNLIRFEKSMREHNPLIMIKAKPLGQITL